MANELDKQQQLENAEKTHKSIVGLSQKQSEQVDDYIGKLDKVIKKERWRFEFGRKTRIQTADQTRQILKSTKDIEGTEADINHILQFLWLLLCL